MSSIFDLVKLYPSEWKETAKRKFTPEECDAVQACTVVPSKYGKSVCFVLAKGKSFIPLEPSAIVSIGDNLDMHKLEIVSLNYVGTDEDQTVTRILRIRVPNETPAAAVSFDNPFGV